MRLSVLCKPWRDRKCKEIALFSNRFHLGALIFFRIQRWFASCLVGRISLFSCWASRNPLRFCLALDSSHYFLFLLSSSSSSSDSDHAVTPICSTKSGWDRTRECDRFLHGLQRKLSVVFPCCLFACFSWPYLCGGPLASRHGHASRCRGSFCTRRSTGVSEFMLFLIVIVSESGGNDIRRWFSPSP